MGGKSDDGWGMLRGTDALGRSSWGFITILLSSILQLESYQKIKERHLPFIRQTLNDTQRICGQKAGHALCINHLNDTQRRTFDKVVCDIII